MLNEFQSLRVKSLLTVGRVQNLHSGSLRKFQSRHHWLREYYLECFGHFVLVIWQDPDLPGRSGLARVELHLFLGLPTEVFVLLCRAILCANTCAST